MVAALGATFVAGMGFEVFHDWGEIECYIVVSAVTEQDLGRHGRYQQLFGLYREIYQALKNPHYLDRKTFRFSDFRLYYL